MLSDFGYWVFMLWCAVTLIASCIAMLWPPAVWAVVALVGGALLLFLLVAVAAVREEWRLLKWKRGIGL